MGEKKLTAKQKAFCEYYAASRNKTQAAVDAGYGNGRKSAAEIGHRLTKKPEILEYIRQLDRQAARAIGITPELIAARSEKLYQSADAAKRDNQALKVLKFQNEIAKDMQKAGTDTQIDIRVMVDED